MLSFSLKNEAKEILKQYLFWTDFLSQGFGSIDALKKGLQTIQDKMVYKDEFGVFYLTREEAEAFKKRVIPLSIKEVLESELYPLLLSERLSRVTVYEKSDLKQIQRGSEVVWLYNADVLMHFVLKDGRYIYPQDYPVNSPYRFGYMVVHNKNGLQGVYDIDNDRLKVPIVYEDIKLFANIAELSKDGKNYEMVDLDTNESIDASSKRSKINPSKLDMEDYIPLFPTPKNAQDLVKMGLWDAKVGVLEVPSHYRAIIEDTTGVIRWDYPVSGDVFDMSIELPVQFKKRDGEFVTVGIKHEYIILEDRSILNEVEIPLENDDS